MEPESLQSEIVQTTIPDLQPDVGAASAGITPPDTQSDIAPSYPPLPVVAPPTTTQMEQRTETVELHRMAASALHHAIQVMAGCGCASCQDAIHAIGGNTSTAQTERTAAEHEQFRALVSQNLDRMATILQSFTERVEHLAAQPLTNGPAAMQTRGFQSLPLQEQIGLLQSAASRTNDPALQMEAAAAILQMQRSK